MKIFKILESEYILETYIKIYEIFNKLYDSN